ncbi:NUDIX hydrolase [Salmonella enterica]|nr:NUDIX hydrolase [Salmonella enterica]EKK6596351.1 NUDIX hydrolase [Salmonella enterica]
MNKLMLKAQVQGYRRKDGIWVKPHDDGKGAAKPDAPAPTQKAKKVVTKAPWKPTPKPVPYGVHRTAASKGLPQQITHHPRYNDDGRRVVIQSPTAATTGETWTNPHETATFTPDGDFPRELNGAPLTDWQGPVTDAGWQFVKGTNASIKEPPFKVTPGKHAAAGVIIEEDDGRIWLVTPTNSFGGYKNSFPKGTCEKGLSIQQNAIKEAWEEAGLKIEITGFVGDFERTTSVARIYTARRVAGNPTDMGWESQAVKLVPKHKLLDELNMLPDHMIVEAYLSSKKA